MTYLTSLSVIALLIDNLIANNKSASKPLLLFIQKFCSVNLEEGLINLPYRTYSIASSSDV